VAFSIEIPSMGIDGSWSRALSSEHGQDEVGRFQYHGFVDQDGAIWFVKPYKNHGWLYCGRLDVEERVMRGTWGSNRKLWFGSFELRPKPL
jgi:hypothetical protein